MNRLHDKVAIVTGAAHGIGRAVSEIFAAEGAWVLVTDIDAAAGEQAAAAIRDRGGQAQFCRVDIGREDEIVAAVKRVSDQFGRVDVLCNNAAHIGRWHGVLEAPAEEWLQCLHVTLLGTNNCTRAVLPWMIAQQRGSIIVMSSIQGLVGCPDSAPYTSVKAGLLGFMRSAACDYGRYNIRVNAIAPGPIQVGYSPKPGEPAYAYQVAHTYLGRVGTPRDVGYAALYLASDESAFVTGAVLPVDGGWSAM